jgi:hypothetical protein
MAGPRKYDARHKDLILRALERFRCLEGLLQGLIRE